MTRLLSLRKEDPPGGDVVVVRGGEMHPNVIRRAATRAFEETGMYGVSVFLCLDHDVPELCRSVPDLSRYGRVRTSSADALRSDGFALLSTGRRPHFTVVLPDVEDATLTRLDHCFGPTVRNPGR
jgi:hypothetical protein